MAQSLVVWQFIYSSISEDEPVTLLYVLESLGSSPGRHGFYMATSADECVGTIGGGIMEYKLVELSRKMMVTGDNRILLKTQYHDKEHMTDQSGMICSGMQRVVIIPLSGAYKSEVQEIISAFRDKRQIQLQISPEGIALDHHSEEMSGLRFEDVHTWIYRQMIGTQSKVHVIGAGHVSLALSELMSKLGFYVIVYDDRHELNTFLQNEYADEKHIVNYTAVGDLIPENENEYLVIMTIGYRTDKEVLLQLMHKRFKYVGMLGSEAKIETLFDEFVASGIPEEKFAHVRAPIGLPIHSRTAYEIAVSIAAEIIAIQNRS